ncbi:MAG: hypothetical protein HW387_1564 [Parachlamydiales bacterium]|nr:hypothetical protein [Parachlamydiales bacterium]
MNFFRIIVKLLLVIGALNWGLIGFFKYNLIANLFGGEASAVARIIFSLVGLAGLYAITCFCKACSLCGCGCCKKNNGQQ